MFYQKKVAKILNLSILLLFTFSFGQDEDEKYREDQIYFSVYYNSLNTNINEFKENKFSNSINLGFIRDIPLNKSGRFAIGIGTGLGINLFNNNLTFQHNDNDYNFEIKSFNSFKKNTYSFSEIQVPLEIRWRSSSISKYRFWRIYTGLKYSRLLSQKYKFKDQNSTFSTSDVFINRNQLGFTINIGYNTWNLGLYKSVVPFFNKNNKNTPVDVEQFKLGLVFYIL